MKKTTEKVIQFGLGNRDASKQELKNLWVEIPAYCNLACSYCYANGGAPENPEDLLTEGEYDSILEQLAGAGGDSIGIPGAGEPLIRRILPTTMHILERCDDLGLYATLFTTGEFIDETLADKLHELPVELMIKGNTLNPDIQDQFVSDPERGRIIHGYGQKRNEALDLLMAKGFNKPNEQTGRKSRMALVTSIMTNTDGSVTNYAEMADILRYCRENNIIFDVDSVLKRGRGASCDLCEEDQRLKTKLQELQKIDREEFGNFWELSQSYIGTVCDRFSYHMYISQHGEIRPCIGAMDVNLGNVRNTTLQGAWDTPEMRIIRARNYRGKCGDECLNFAEIDPATGKPYCNSCLGRRTENLTNEFLLEHGYVPTIGCWNHRPRNSGG